MKIDQIDINALKFGILCNFTPFCGKELAKESVEIVRELERLADIGRATEKAFENDGAVAIYETYGEFCFARYKENIAELMEWYKAQEVTDESLR